MMHVLAFENDSLAYCVKMLMHQRFLQVDVFACCIAMLLRSTVHKLFSVHALNLQIKTICLHIWCFASY